MSPSAQDPSEEFVFQRCQKLYFALWSYLNPLRHDGAELCDVLISFGDHLLIISVKHVDFDPEAENPAVGIERWRRRAIERSVRQARGAKRYLMQQGRYEVRSRGLSDRVVIEDIGRKRIHCISMSLGSQGHIPISWGEDGDSPSEMVHIFTETSLESLLTELSTISDLVTYLAKVEDFYSRNTAALVMGSELDLLALYVQGNRSFPDWSQANMVVMDGDLWEGVVSRPEYRERLRRDEASYFWDLVVKDLVEHQLGNTYIAGTGRETLEPLLREIASESRFARRVLSLAFMGILHERSNTRSRIIQSPDGTLYVFMRVRRDENADAIAGELLARCHVALGQVRASLSELRAIGLATQPLDDNNLRSHVSMMITYPEWNEELETRMREYQAMGIFRSPVQNRVREDEYPNPEA